MYKNFTLLPAAAYTSTAFNTGGEDLGEYGSASFYLDVTVGTTGTCIVKIQESPDNTIWFDSTTFGTVSATTKTERLLLSQLGGRYYRTNVALSGTNPSYTMSVVGVAKK